MPARTMNEKGGSDDDVVITGISGRLPESENIEEFRSHLINGEDMVTDDDRRWQSGTVDTCHYYIGWPRYGEKLADL